MSRGICRFSIVLLLVVIALTYGLLNNFVDLRAQESSFFDLKDNQDRPRNLIIPPLLSYVLPGFDQWWEGQIGPAVSYSGLAMVGLGISLDGSEPKSPLSTLDNEERKFVFGAQLFSTSGYLSSYHSFRSAVRSRKKNGEFSFLKQEETPMDLLWSPFRFDHLTRWTSLIPFALEVTLFLSAIISEVKITNLTGSDVLFAGTTSYNAGVGEEAAFRGYLQPMFYHYLGEGKYAGLMSNGITSLIFTSIHIGKDNPVPWPQFLISTYLGWVSQLRNWSLSEVIFQHFWWDMTMFSIVYMALRKEKFDEDKEKKSNEAVSVYLPFSFAF